MIAIVIYMLASIGLAYIVGISEISYPIRGWMAEHPTLHWLLRLIECPVCFGTWSGLIAGVWLNPLHLPYGMIANSIVTALATAGSNLMLARAGGLVVPGVPTDPSQESHS